MKPIVLHEDNHVIVVRKPVGTLSQEDHTKDLDLLTLIKGYLKEKYNKPGNVYLGLVQRLDRMVGGVMVFAKTSKAAARLNAQMRQKTIDKRYYAVVHGKTVREATLIDYLVKDPKTNLTRVVDPSHPEGKRAELTFNTIESNADFSLLSIQLITGRPHQIRVQLKQRGHPLYGDKRYGHEQDTGDIVLFAYSLSFNHPTTKERLTFTIKPEAYPFSTFDALK